MTEATTITPNVDKNVDIKPFKFRFKKDKLDNQRPTVEVNGPVPSVEGIVDILTRGDKKEVELLFDALQDVVRGAVAGDVSDDEKYSQATLDSAMVTIKVPNADGKTFTEETVPKYSWRGIAYQPREDRRASNIPAEDWEKFAQDYIAIMPGITGKDVEAITNATVVYLKKFSIVKTNKPVLSKLKDQLALYTEHTKKGEDFQEILELLVRKADAYLGSDEVEKLVQNL